MSTLTYNPNQNNAANNRSQPTPTNGSNPAGNTGTYTSPSLTTLTATGSNPLHKYQTYNCLFTLAVLDRTQLNSGRFSAPEIKNIICSTKGDWNNPGKRASTTFGSFDYWIDDVSITSQPSFAPSTGNSFATKVTFRVVEPYSMGLFMLTCKEAASKAGYLQNYQTAPYLLMIEYAGYVNEQPQIDSKLTRYIPIHFIKVNFRVTGSGTVYDCEAVPYNEMAFRENAARSLTDVTLRGADVRTLLKGPEKSLETAIRQQLIEATRQRNLDRTDQYEIIFPKDYQSTSDDGNDISRSIVFNDLNDAGTVPFPDYDKVFNNNRNIVNSQRVTINPDKNFHFPQSIKIQDIIQEVVIRSRYITDQIEGNTIKTDSRGFVNWFRIETHVRDLEDNPQYNRQNRIYVYRVVPYRVHVSRLNPPNTQTPNLQNLRNSVSRIYKYVYTGQNTDIIDVNLEFNQAWTITTPFDAGTRTGTNNANQGGLGAGGAPAAQSRDPTSTGPAAIPPAGSSNGNDLSPTQDVTGYQPTRVVGGAGNDSEKTAQTRFLISRIANDGDLLNLELTIHGDPYYLPSSGMGNQIMSRQSDNELDDGSMNYQESEVHVLVQFRTPIDLDPVSGLYKFDKEVNLFSGLYMVRQVESKFVKNNFTQTLSLMKVRNEYGVERATNPIAVPAGGGAAP